MKNFSQWLLQKYANDFTVHLRRGFFINISIKSIWQNLKISVPKIGDKYKLVNLCFKNAKNIQKDRIRKNEELRHRLDNKRVLEQLQQDLRLSSKPRHIECFDNSNIQGTNPVAACVIFKSL